MNIEHNNIFWLHRFGLKPFLPFLCFECTFVVLLFFCVRSFPGCQQSGEAAEHFWHFILIPYGKLFNAGNSMQIRFLNAMMLLIVRYIYFIYKYLTLYIYFYWSSCFYCRSLIAHLEAECLFGGKS